MDSCVQDGSGPNYAQITDIVKLSGYSALINRGEFEQCGDGILRLDPVASAEVPAGITNLSWFPSVEVVLKAANCQLHWTTIRDISITSRLTSSGRESTKPKPRFVRTLPGVFCLPGHEHSVFISPEEYPTRFPRTIREDTGEVTSPVVKKVEEPAPARKRAEFSRQPMTYLAIGVKVLRRAGEPLSAGEMWDKALEDELIANVGPNTRASFNGAIAAAAAKNKDIKRSGGQYTLRASAYASANSDDDSGEENYSEPEVQPQEMIAITKTEKSHKRPPPPKEEDFDDDIDDCPRDPSELRAMAATQGKTRSQTANMPKYPMRKRITRFDFLARRVFPTNVRLENHDGMNVLAQMALEEIEEQPKPFFELRRLNWKRIEAKREQRREEMGVRASSG